MPLLVLHAQKDVKGSLCDVQVCLPHKKTPKDDSEECQRILHP